MNFKDVIAILDKSVGGHATHMGSFKSTGFGAATANAHPFAAGVTVASAIT